MAENKPQIPTLKESQKEDRKGAPPLKIKGLQSGLSLIERLKQFKKKDLAFILAGLGVLFMAPLAEHFMMSPESGQGSDQMSPGFGKSGSGVFGGAPNVYDGGLNGLAPGGAAGSGSDVITPLNVRDPSALVMGPNATQQPAATSSAPSAPPPPPPAKDDSKWNDAIAAGKAAASSAVKKAALPVPKVPLSAGGLRGLGAVSGGSGSSFSLPAINSNGLTSGHVNQSNGLTGTNGSGFKGVARGPGTGGNTGRLEDLKNKAAAQAGDMNRTGSASNALEAAASRDMSGGSGDGGAGGESSHDDKATSGSQSKDSKTPGESLDFLRQKEQMEKDIAFADELRKGAPCPPMSMLTAGFSNAGNLKCNEIANDVEKSILEDGLVKPVASALGDKIKGWLGGGSGKLTCCDQKNAAGPYADCIPVTDPPKCSGDPTSGDKDHPSSGGSCIDTGGYLHMNQTGAHGEGFKCINTGDGKPVDQDNSNIDPTHGAIPGADLSQATVGNFCKGADGYINTNAAKQGGGRVVDTGSQAKIIKDATALKGAGGDMGALEIMIAGRNNDATDCGPAVTQGLPTSPTDLDTRIKDARQRLRTVTSALNFKVVKNDNDMAGTEDGPLWSTYKTANDKVNNFFSTYGLPLADGNGTASQISQPDMNGLSADKMSGDKYLYSKADIGPLEGDLNKTFDELKGKAQAADQGVLAADAVLKRYASGSAPELQNLGTELGKLYNDIDSAKTALLGVKERAGAAVSDLDPKKDQGTDALVQGAAGMQKTIDTWVGHVNHLEYEQGELQHAYTDLTATIKPDGLVGKAHLEAINAVQQALGGAPAATGVTSMLDLQQGTYRTTIIGAFNEMNRTAPANPPTTDTEKKAAQFANMPVINAQAAAVQGIQKKMIDPTAAAPGAPSQGTKGIVMGDLAAAGDQLKGTIERKLTHDGTGAIKPDETWTPPTAATAPSTSAPTQGAPR